MLTGEWKKSSLCDSAASCVEVRRVSGGVEVRDTERPGQVLFLADSEWEDFLRGAEDGEFDLVNTP